LQWLRPKGADTVLEAETINAGIQKEKELGSEVGVMDMFRNPVDRRRTVLSVCAVTVQAGSGAMFIIGMPIKNLRPCLTMICLKLTPY
jgi:hypothetical protein